MNGLAIFAPVAPVCSTASFVLPESSGQRDRACASVSGLDTPEAFLFKLLFSEWHRLMTCRRHVMFWICCGICCSCSSHLDALWQHFCSCFSDTHPADRFQHFLFILQWYPSCRFQLPSPAQERLEPPLPSCSLAPLCRGCVSQLGAAEGSSSLGTGRWLRQAVQEQGLRAVLVLAQLQGHSSAHAALPRRAACCARGQSACSSRCHLPQTQPATNLQPLPLSLLQTCLEIRDVRNRSLHFFSCSSERSPPQIIHQFTFSGVENTFSYLQSPNVPIYFCTVAYLFPRLFLLISPYLFLSVK